jgi:hypothetical protein
VASTPEWHTESYRYHGMTKCLEEADVKDIGHSAVAQFDRNVALIPEDLCAPFHSQAMKLESELLMVYQMVARICKKLDDLDSIASLWDVMVTICDSSLKSLRSLVDRHPQCGANSFYDKVLDLRNKCERLKQMHC